MESPVDSTKPTILLVEDMLTQALLMQHQLKRAGYTVKLVRSGQAALAEIEKESYGLILSDINMPGMDGFELCRQVKSKEQLKQVPFILLATPVQKDEILQMLASGADNFILKAFDEENFLARLDEIVRTSNLRKDAGSAAKSFYAGRVVEVPASSVALADFLLSAFEMYVYQLSKPADPAQKE
jgi:two-component system, sensor histidine kinase and response regulator